MITRRVPFKWKKYLKLVEYGLITIDELERDIRRYAFTRAEEMLCDLQRELSQDKGVSSTRLYVVKLVPIDQSGQLPNLRVRTPQDLEDFDWFLRSKGNFVEIWYCRTLIDSSIFSVAGRLAFCYNYFPRSQVVEQVWWCSPRLIESFSGTFPFPYARASRSEWGRHYSIESVHNTGAFSHFSTTEQEAQFRQSLLQLEKLRNPIERFQQFVESYGIESFSLEYKIVGTELSIIDWDTNDDGKIIGS